MSHHSHALVHFAHFVPGDAAGLEQSTSGTEPCAAANDFVLADHHGHLSFLIGHDRNKLLLPGAVDDK